MPYTAEEKQRAVGRLRRIRGQAEALERAVLAGTDCGTLLQQISALRGATNGLMAEVLESHLRETFGAAAPAPKPADKPTGKPVRKSTAKSDAQATSGQATVPVAAHREAEIDRLVRLVRSYLK